jgi:hypothetical protein
VKEPVRSPVNLVFSLDTPGCNTEPIVKPSDVPHAEYDVGHSNSQYDRSHPFPNDSLDVSAAVEHYGVYDPTRPHPIIPGQPNAGLCEDSFDANDSNNDLYDGESSKGDDNNQEARMDKDGW